MPLISGPTFSKANILSAVETLTWSSLPVLADQAVQQLFMKNIPPNPKIDRTLTGLITCAIIILYLPKGSPACIGAPCLYLAYRTALSYWNRKPKPPKTPTNHQPHTSAPASKAAATDALNPPAKAPAAAQKGAAQKPTSTSKAVIPSPAKKPAATVVVDKAAASKPDEGLSPPVSAGFAPKSQTAIAATSSAKPPAAAQEETSPAATNTSKPAAACPVPVSSPERPTNEHAKKKSDVSPDKLSTGTGPTPDIMKELDQLEKKARALEAQESRLNREVKQNLTSIQVKVTITSLLQKKTEEIATTFYIQPHILFKFPQEMIPTLQKEMKKQYSITEDTSFCWVHLCREILAPSRFPFVYFPIETLRPLAWKKKTTVLRIETESEVIEIQFLRAGCQAIGKCLEKLDACKRHEIIQVAVSMGPASDNLSASMKEFAQQTVAAFTMPKCYLTPLEKP